MRPDIIFLDIDGVLLNDHSEIDYRDREILLELKRCGSIIGYLTSRSDRKLSTILEGMPCDFIGSLNGSILRFYENGQLVWEQVFGIPWDKGQEILNIVNTIPVEHISVFFFPYQLWDGQISYNNQVFGRYPDALNCISPIRFQRIRLYSPQQLPVLPADLCRTIYEGNDVIIESKQFDKGFAVQSVLEYYGLLSTSAICFGDGEADISMFHACGTSIAPINASEDVRSHATGLTCDNNSACVAHWFEKEYLIKNVQHLQGSIDRDDCVYLLKDITGMIEPLSASKKRALINKGTPATLFLAEDPPVSAAENEMFLRLLDQNRFKISEYVGVLAESILAEKGTFPVLVSLVRGGVVYGVLCRKYYQKFYHTNVVHYAVSLIRGYGIDEQALNYIVNRHGDSSIQFVDGWTGSGLINKELQKYIASYNETHGTNISAKLAVLADTSGVCYLSGTREDVMLPDCCLNTTICGLISSVCINPCIIAPTDFYGATKWDAFANIDFSQYFIDTISSCLTRQRPKEEQRIDGLSELLRTRLMTELGVSESSRIRFGIGESTRAIFRNEIKSLMVKNRTAPELRFVVKMAEDRAIRIIEYDLDRYMCVAVLA